MNSVIMKYGDIYAYFRTLGVPFLAGISVTRSIMFLNPINTKPEGLGSLGFEA